MKNLIHITSVKNHWADWPSPTAQTTEPAKTCDLSSLKPSWFPPDPGGAGDGGLGLLLMDLPKLRNREHWFIVCYSTILSTSFSILIPSLCCFEGAPLKIPLGSTVYHLLIKQCLLRVLWARALPFIIRGSESGSILPVNYSQLWAPCRAGSHGPVIVSAYLPC